MSSGTDTQLTPIEGYDPKTRMIFSKPSVHDIPDSKPKLEYRRINITTRNEDGTVGDLIIPTGRKYSFGLGENFGELPGQITGYTFPLCIWGRDGPTEAEKIWTNKFGEIVDCCIDHLVENRESIERFELVRGDLTKMKGGLNPLYWKTEVVTDPITGKASLRRVPDRGPTLYTKIIYSKKQNKFLTQFYDTNGVTIEAKTLMNRYCHATCAVRIESIFIGNRISLQVKLYEAMVEPCDGGMKRLLAPRPEATPGVLMEGEDDDIMGEDARSLAADDDEDHAPVEPPPTRPALRAPRRTG